MTTEPNNRIYLLPNLMTAGNLFFGFMAIIQIISGALEAAARDVDPVAYYYRAVLCILGAFVCDMLDGRLARLGGVESTFGKEFDSLADVVSFGVAPALLVYQIVLRDFPRLGWMVASLYLLCGALRLARFNSTPPDPKTGNTEFTGFPIPAAAGLTASITLLILWLDEGQRKLGNWKYALAVLMIALSFLMFSKFKYPSFKNLSWRSTRSVPQFLIIAILLAATALHHEWMPAVLFIVYLAYGIARPLLGRSMRQEIDRELEESDEPRTDIDESAE